MSSIRSILEELNEYDTKKHPEFIDQAMKDISELIDRAKPNDIDTLHLSVNQTIDQYQNNLKELLK